LNFACTIRNFRLIAVFAYILTEEERRTVCFPYVISYLVPVTAIYLCFLKCARSIELSLSLSCFLSGVQVSSFAENSCVYGMTKGRNSSPPPFRTVKGVWSRTRKGEEEGVLGSWPKLRRASPIVCAKTDFPATRKPKPLYVKSPKSSSIKV
jgi:hypothetical protein